MYKKAVDAVFHILPNEIALFDFDMSVFYKFFIFFLHQIW